MQAHEFTAKSVDEAIEEGLATLNVTRDAVDIDILQKGSRGIFGIGSEPAIVRLTLRTVKPITEEPPEAPSPQTSIEPSTQDEADIAAEPIAEVEHASVETPSTTEAEVGTNASIVADDEDLDKDDEFALTETEEDAELAQMAADILGEMIELMGFDAHVTASWQEEDDEDDEYLPERYLRLDVEGTDLGALIGRRGETLENIQYLLRLIVNQKLHQWKNIVVDVEHYKERRVTQLTQLAERMADQVGRTGKPLSLEPMPANERRIVHMVLRDHPDVYTESYGDGPRRKVHILVRE